MKRGFFDQSKKKKSGAARPSGATETNANGEGAGTNATETSDKGSSAPSAPPAPVFPFQSAPSGSAPLEKGTIRTVLDQGTALLKEGDVTGAVRVLTRATEVDSANPEAFNELGVALGRNSDQIGAIKSFRRAIAIEPKFAKAHNNLGVALGLSGDMAGAVEAFKEVVALDPSSTSKVTETARERLRHLGTLNGCQRLNNN